MEFYSYPVLKSIIKDLPLVHLLKLIISLYLLPKYLLCYQSQIARLACRSYFLPNWTTFPIENLKKKKQILSNCHKQLMAIEYIQPPVCLYQAQLSFFIYFKLLYHTPCISSIFLLANVLFFVFVYTAILFSAECHLFPYRYLLVLGTVTPHQLYVGMHGHIKLSSP